jgi:hypothetical protein
VLPATDEFAVLEVVGVLEPPVPAELLPDEVVVAATLEDVLLDPP